MYPEKVIGRKLMEKRRRNGRTKLFPTFLLFNFPASKFSRYSRFGISIKFCAYNSHFKFYAIKNCTVHISTFFKLGSLICKKRLKIYWKTFTAVASNYFVKPLFPRRTSFIFLKSGIANPWHFGVDPDPDLDPRIHASD